MKKAFLKDEAFVESVKSSIPNDESLSIWWVGQSGFLVCSKVANVLFDPYLSDSLTEKYSKTDKPHVRITEKVVSPNKLDFIDIVTSSHNHTDHLDASTLDPLFLANPSITFIIPEANRNFIANRLNCDANWPLGLNDNESRECCGVEISGVPAAHERVDRDQFGSCHYMGYVLKVGKWSIYHSGDTLLYEGIKDVLTPFKIDIALLPINGRKPERRVAGNLDGQQAVSLAKDIGASCVIPCHYDMFEFNTESTELFESTAIKISQPYCILKNGQGMTTKNLGLKPRSD